MVMGVTVPPDLHALTKQITSINATALRLFGYTNRDVIGRNVSYLIPEPFASIHDKYCYFSNAVPYVCVCCKPCACVVSARRAVSAYMNTGRETVLNSTRIMFGLNSNGAIFPIMMGVKHTPTGFGALIQQIHTTERYVMFMKSTGVITGCCTESFRVLGLTADHIRSEAVTIEKWIPNFKALVESPVASSVASQLELKVGGCVAG